MCSGGRRLINDPSYSCGGERGELLLGLAGNTAARILPFTLKSKKVTLFFSSSPPLSALISLKLDEGKSETFLSRLLLEHFPFKKTKREIFFRLSPLSQESRLKGKQRNSPGDILALIFLEEGNGETKMCLSLSPSPCLKSSHFRPRKKSYSFWEEAC